MKNLFVETQRRSNRFSALLVFLFFILLSASLAAEGTLFVGLEGSSPTTYTTDMAGFPNVNWTPGFAHDVSGAAATPDGTIYITEGAFTTHLYSFTLGTTPQQLCTIDIDITALAYGNGTLYGYSNYSTPKGIYTIDPNTGATSLVLDVYTGTGFLFFALDFNPEDGLFYGFTEYGAYGLYSINIDTSEMIHLSNGPVGFYGMSRALAIGNNTVYLCAVSSTDNYFAYDISQGVGGAWVEFPNPNFGMMLTGGAAFIPAPVPTIQINGRVIGSDEPFGLENCDVILTGDTSYQTQTDLNGYFLLENVLANADYTLEISLDGYETYNENIQAGEDDIDLGTIVLNELVYPATDVLAVVNEGNTEVTLTWNSPSPEARDLESYDVYRFLESNSATPILWDLIADDFADTIFVDNDWILLELDFYQYTVVAVYTNGLEAEAAFSNVVEKLPVFNPPQNFTVDPYSGLATWDPPVPSPGVTLIEYNVFLDAEMFTTTETEWLFENLINGTIYTAGIQAVYDLGISDYMELNFVYLGTGADNDLISRTELLGNYPNPFNPTTTISFSMAENVENAELIIYNLKGQKVKIFTNLQITKSPNQQIIWDGTDQMGTPVSSGIYLYRLEAGAYSESKKMILMK